jgi:hypothetical protein
VEELVVGIVRQAEVENDLELTVAIAQGNRCPLCGWYRLKSKKPREHLSYTHPGAS